MMYEGAIKFIKKAMAAIDRDDRSEKGLYLGKAYDVIMELNNTLDHKIGGELAANLENLYLFMTDQLTKANIDNDKTKLEAVLKILYTLYEGWKEAIESLKKQENETQQRSKEG